jgi:hypothetical protein
MITLRNGFLLLVWLGFSLVGFCIACYKSVFLFSAISGLLLVIIPSVTLLRRYLSKVNIKQRMKTGYKTQERTKHYEEVLANVDVIENGKPEEV